jgi:hypothetical protein
MHQPRIPEEAEEEEEERGEKGERRQGGRKQLRTQNYCLQQLPGGGRPLDPWRIDVRWYAERELGLKSSTRPSET